MGCRPWGHKELDECTQAQYSTDQWLVQSVDADSVDTGMGRLYYAMVFKILEHLWILISVGEKVEGGGVSHGTNSLTTAEGWLYLQFLFNFVLPLLCVLVTQSCPTLCDPTNCSPPGFSVHGILQTRILEWVAIPFSRGTS